MMRVSVFYLTCRSKNEGVSFRWRRIVAGVPFGVGIIQTAGREDLLIKYGSAIENLIKEQTKPKYRNIDAENYMYAGVNPDTI